ncbi:hypothetical protein FFT87_08025 [Salinibacterium sp. M195]|nr:hypothetical protein FFT87_08025 [Salinibacterium sp. M195]
MSHDGTPERTLTRRELRELRARQDAESPAAETASPEASVEPAPAETDSAAEPVVPARGFPPVNSVAPAEVKSLPANENADAVAHYPYSGSAGQASTPPSSSALTVEPEVAAYVEPPALIDPLAVVPEAAAANAAAEDALSAFESLLANADGSANDPAANETPRSPLVDRLSDSTPAKSVAELDFSDPAGSAAAGSPASTGSADKDSAAPALAADWAGAKTAPEPTSAASLAGLLGLAPEPAAEAPTEASAAAPTNLSNARAEFDEQARKRLDGVLPTAQVGPGGDAEAKSAPAAPNAALNAAPAVAALKTDVPQIDSSALKLIPVGHWSRQAAVEEEPNNSVSSRTISSGTSATSALVLPAIPFATDIRGPLNSKGEAVLTGSIDLPHTLSASGVSDRFDHADIDSLLDLNDSDMVSTDSAPVRAVKAVSTFSNQSVTQTQKPKGTRALTVLLISASSMAVVVAGLLVAAFAFNML